MIKPNPMKLRTISTILLGILTFLGVHAQEKEDTVKVIKNVKHVIVERDSTTTFATVEYIGKDGESYTYNYELTVLSGEPEYDFDFEGNIMQAISESQKRSQNKKNKSAHSRRNRNMVISDETGMRHIYWGWHYNYGAPDVKDCFELGIRNVIGYIWKRGKSEFETGLGFGMQRLLARDGYAYTKEGNSLFTTPVAADANMDYSRLDIWKFNIPLIYTFRPYSKVRFCLGGDINLNSYAKASTKFRIRSESTKNTFNHLQQNLFTADIYAAIYCGCIGIYGTWCPMPAFKASYGPTAKSTSIGISLLL